MSSKIKLAVSACLLGENVRYDGGHKLEPIIREKLGPFVDFIPICPEVECGLPIPREPMRLMGKPNNPRLMTITTRTDHTQKMNDWARKKLKVLAKQNVCAYIFKSKSPSCGLTRIKIYGDHSQPIGLGAGLWARMFMQRFPHVPVVDEASFYEPGFWEMFVGRMFSTK
jgi:uncharacterized protein YbbK (DUF523 family)